jgi:hypothetical protein
LLAAITEEPWGEGILPVASDSLSPLLNRAQKVVVFAFPPYQSGLRASADHLVEHLVQHSVTAQVSECTNTGGITVAPALFKGLDTQMQTCSSRAPSAIPACLRVCLVALVASF